MKLTLLFRMMNKTKYFFVFMLASMLHGCITDRYNLSKDIIAELCISPDGFSLGGDNNADIPLSQVIELKDSGELIVDAEGNYMFYKSCDTLKSTDIRVGQGSICSGVQASIPNRNIKDIATVTPMKRNPSYGNLEFSDYMSLEFDTDVMVDCVSDIVYVTSPMQIMIVSRLEQLAPFCDNVTLKYEVPSFYDLADESELTETVSKNEFNKVHRHYINIKGVNFKQVSKHPYEAIGFNGKTGVITMEGRIGVSGSSTVNIANYESAVSPKFTIQAMIDPIAVTDVKGNFNKSEVVKIDPIELDNLPDFLLNDEVVVDVENPIVRLSVDNEVPTDITLAAEFTGYRNKKAISKLNVGKDYGNQDIIVYGPVGNDTIRRTNVWISRKSVEIPDSVDDNVVLPEMNTLFRKMPQSIEVEAIAKTDPARLVVMSLTKTYHATPRYELAVPLRIGKEMKIVYEKSINDVHDYLKNVSVGSIDITCEAVNRIPLNLHVVGEAIDKYGHAVDGVIIHSEDVIPANSSKHIMLTLESADDEQAVQKVYKIKFKAYAESSEELEGQLLNVNQNLRLNDVRMVLKGARYRF